MIFRRISGTLAPNLARNAATRGPTTIYFIKRSIDERRALSRNIGTVMRKCMFQDAAKNYTAIKQVAGKKVFKETEFYKYLEDAVLSRLKKSKQIVLNEKQFKEAIQSVLNNVKDWNGKRTERRRNANFNNNMIEEQDEEQNNNSSEEENNNINYE
ncbi:AP-4 complex subunit beta [Monomorium pharaonis]|uniref:AP-4 complex subunit beta n=1 Tax=Monomorium pharaonis TaxID=307658 RepID=UPI001747C0A0|nr:AP-4 complex subunit beta [Monomorium pharaonis]XP_036138269.1 AP-4 complex subunit beta [Monomorium pharaonis]